MRRALFAAAPLLAIPWFVGVVLGRPAAPVAIGAPPHLPEGDVLAGAMYPWAETDDAVAIDAPRETLVLRNDGERTTLHLDAIGLAIFDEPVVRTTTGAFLAVREARELGARTTAETRAGRVTSFALPPRDGPAVIVVHARSTRFAEDAFFRYVAAMGQGLDALMERAVRTDCPREHTVSCATEVMEDEQRRLGLPLHAEVRDGDVVRARFVVPPPGATRARAIALPFTGPATELRLDFTPDFWAIERVAIGRDGGAREPSAMLAPVDARVDGGGEARDVTAAVARPDGARAVLAPGERVALRFSLDPLHNARSPVFAHVSARGFYRVPFGGRALLDPFAIFAHRAGLTTLPRFAAEPRR